ncbi:MAG: type I pullulanase, partial [Bacilli bacterium]|nr:type I pullulanase [Bacilli bacterium]
YQDEILQINSKPLMDLSIIDEEFYYDGDDLGSTYTKDKTVFKLWSPLATKCSVILFDNEWKENEIFMSRGEKGVFTVEVERDLLNTPYRLSSTVDGIKKVAIDPYARGSLSNSGYSVVVDLANTYKFKYDDKLSPFKCYCDAVIYETSVRDLTSYENTSIVNKGKFLGACEEGKVTAMGARLGIDHIKKLGITHVQLQPVLDFLTVNEDNVKEKYNWGYDPCQYFALEGSYCTKPFEALSRINEFKEMVDIYHKNDLRIVLDIVLNHIYEHEQSSFELLVPNFYFRKNEDGTMSNGSYCGNDFASERKMVSKFMVDCCKFLIDFYHVDGFRFDLMGIIDVDTMLKIQEECRAIKKDIMLYGEGWNMPTNLPLDKKAIVENYKKLPGYAFFNDCFRDMCKGESMQDLGRKGFFLGNREYHEGFCFAFQGSSLATEHLIPKYDNACCSINYVECHDNETIYDKLKFACKNEKEEIKLKRITLMNEVLMLSYGIPFIHMGQEIGQSKKGDTNSYKSDDSINQLNYDLMEQRKWMLKSLNDIIKVRKQFKCFRLSNPDEISKNVHYEELDNGVIIVHYDNKELIAPYDELKVFINPTRNLAFYDFDGYANVVYNGNGMNKGEALVHSLMISPLSLYVIGK